MKKLAIAFAGLAAIGFSGAAFADEASTTENTTAKAMTDAEMDKETAGGARINIHPPGGPLRKFVVGPIPGNPPLLDNKAVTIPSY